MKSSKQGLKQALVLIQTESLLRERDLLADCQGRGTLTLSIATCRKATLRDLNVVSRADLCSARKAASAPWHAETF